MSHSVQFSRLSAIAYSLFFLALLLLDAPVLLADDQVAVTVQRPWMRAVPNVMDTTAVYMVLVNNGSAPAQLVGGPFVKYRVIPDRLNGRGFQDPGRAEAAVTSLIGRRELSHHRVSIAREIAKRCNARLKC